MTILTLIPDAKTYGIAILLMLSLGCSNIASHIHSRWFAHKRTNSILLQWIVKFFIILFGITIFPIQELFLSPLWKQLVALPIAVLLGIFALKFEFYIKRILLRRKKYAPQATMNSRYIYHQATASKKFGMTSSHFAGKTNLKNIHEHHAKQDASLTGFNLRDIILVAIGEEIIFRGFLWQFSLLMPSLWLNYTVLIFSVILFGASHISMGKGQFLAKTILGTCCLASVLFAHSILPAIITHVIFNICAYQEMIKANTQYTHKREYSYAL